MYVEEAVVGHLLAGTLRTDLCRICLKENNAMQNVHQEIVINGDSVIIKDVVFSITSIKISEGDCLPECVCSECLQQTLNLHNFKQLCKESDTILKNCIACFNEQTQQTFKNRIESIIIVLPDSKKIETDAKKIQPKSELQTNEGGVKNESQFNLEESLDLEIKSDFIVDKCNVKNEVDLEQLGSVSDADCEVTEEDIVRLLSASDAKNVDAKDDLLVACKREIIDVKKETNETLLDEQKGSFECTMCLSVFYDKESLSDHEKTHGENSRHFCGICYRSYRKLSILKRHVITHMGKRNFVCVVCNKAFFHRNALRAHMRYHQEKKYICKLCKKGFYFRHMLIEHFMAKHSKKKTNVYEGNKVSAANDVKIIDGNLSFDCSMCLESFDNLSDLISHKATHPEGSRHVCRTCGKTYLEAATLKRHSVIHTGKKTYLCTVCGKSFFYRNVLKTHMIYHNEKKYKCEFCDKKFHTRHILREHVRLTHSEDRYSFMCEVCGKLCSSRCRLAIHRESHSKVCCPTCGKSYKNMRYYKAHMRLHDGETVVKKTFICDYCGEERSLKTLLELHILSKHLKERRFKCKVCDKAFFSKGSLNEHGVVHTRERPEQCGVCDRRLINKKALVLHSRLHTGEKPFACNICGERFLSTSRRLVHMKSRHGERSECCKICPARFHLLNDLNKHVLAHMREPSRKKKETVFNTIQ